MVCTGRALSTTREHIAKSVLVVENIRAPSEQVVPGLPGVALRPNAAGGGGGGAKNLSLLGTDAHTEKRRTFHPGCESGQALG